MTGRLAAMLFAALLCGCTSRQPRNLLQLECRGDETVDTQPPHRSVTRRYRIDLRSSALDVWNPEAGQFVRWGKGQASAAGARIAYQGEVRLMDKRVLVSRHIEFDRSSMNIRDRVEASWGSVMMFTGTCDER